jgi:hypothetical protein
MAKESRVEQKESQLPPDRRPLNTLQAKHLAALTGLQARDLVKKTPVDLAEKYKWVIDPQFFFFRKICGRVVKKDPVTGKDMPVPFATVHVMDSDCSFLLFAPGGSPWHWFFPLLCHQEEIASVLTDACGNFCVWVPRWEIDWILKWRRERICFPDIFVRPNIRDLLDDPRLRPFYPYPWPWPPDPGPYIDPRVGPRPGPGPDPDPLSLKGGGMPLRIASELLGHRTTSRLVGLDVSAEFGSLRTERDELLDSPAFGVNVPPPLPEDLLRTTNTKEGMAVSNYMNLPLNSRLLEHFDPMHFIGPFMRCKDIFIPEWSPVLDVPDITFTVTQDVDGDGDEDVIYSEGFFDVRWDAGSITPVKLEAYPNALVGVTCDPPDVPCAEPIILLAGKMPLHNLGGGADPYVDANGYAKRVNRAHPSANLGEVVTGAGALTPVAGAFPLYGCNHYDGAFYYRLLYEFKAPGGLSFTPPTAFVNIAWPLYRWVGHLEKLNVSSDSSGWYTILNDADGWMPSHLLLNWLTGGYADGLYRISMELGNNSKSVMHTTAPVVLRLDNSTPAGTTNGFTALAWREVGTSAWQTLNLVCPVVPRPKGKDIEFSVAYHAAVPHWRSLELSASGCGGGNMQLTSSPLTAYRWHTNPLINSFSGTAVYKLLGTALQGAYSFQLRVDSRAFNPDDSVGLSADWYYNPLHKYNHFGLQVAVVDV